MNQILIYTDGSSRGNPGPGGYGAICMYPNSHGEMRVSEIGGREDLTTNNRMELQAVIASLSYLLEYLSYEEVSEMHVYSDSSYVLNGVTAWVNGWKKNGWITSTGAEVKNADQWKNIVELVEKFFDHSVQIKWHKVKGHAGVLNNERCDEIATAFADNNTIDLYQGDLSGYTAGEYHDPSFLNTNSNTLNSDTDTSSHSDKKIKSSSKSAKVFSYVSLVDNQIFVDPTWGECEKRVKGKSGAKFKKSFSKNDEEKIIKEFLKKS